MENRLLALQWQSPLEISRTRNVLWNGASRLIQVGLQFVFVPIYIYILGSASYGLVVLSATLMAAFSFLEHVASSTVTREFGLHNGNADRSAYLWTMLSSLERVALGVALAIAMVVPFLGYFFTRHWTKADGIDEASLWPALILMGGALAAQFLGMLYAAGLTGLQRQKLLSSIRLLWTPAYYGVGALLLVIIERSVVILFAWQMTAFLILAGAMRWVLLQTMPVASRARDSDYKVMQDISRFGAGSLVLALSGAAVSQIDKLMVAAVSQPVQFAAYGLALSIVMQAMTLATGPFATAMYPHFAQLLSDRDESALSASYHRWAQVVVLVSILSGGLLFWLGPLLIDLWLGAGSALGPNIKRLLPFVLLAWVVNGVITTPVMLIMASGRLSLIYGINLFATVLALLFLPAALARFGMEAGVYYWLGVNLAYCLIMVPLMHRFLLKGAFPYWFLRDVALPILASAVLFAAAFQLLPSSQAPLGILVHAVISVSACMALLLALLPEGRHQLFSSLRFLRS